PNRHQAVAFLFKKKKLPVCDPKKPVAGNNMQLTPRHNAILDIARRQGQVLVDDLAATFDVTPQTVRKDLNDLCKARLLRRIHGGALYPSGVENMEDEARRRIAAHQKEQIGHAAAAM